jgi:4-amino-4-deoxy-L-arabinose transferase-like glycosyltransferase
MGNLNHKIGKILLSLFALILIYSFVASILYAYSGPHWKNQISLNQRLSLNLSIVIFSSVLILLGAKYKVVISEKLMNFASRIRFYKIFIIAFSIRLLWVLWSGNMQTSDFLAYDAMAIDISNGANILEFISKTRNVGASVFIAIYYFLFGYNQILPLLGISILSSVQILLIYKILLKIQNREVAILASFLLTFFPEHILLNNLLGSDVIFSTIIYLAIFLLTKSYDNKSYLNMTFVFMSGITLGLAHWTRSTAPIFIFSVLIIMLLDNRILLIKRVSKVIILVIGFFFIISPIIIYNFQTSGKFDIKPIHGQLGTSLLIGTFLEGDGRIKTWNKTENHELLKKQVNDYLIKNTSKFQVDSINIGKYKRIVADKIYTEIAIERILNNPVDFTKLALKYKVTNLWGIVAGLGFSIDTSVVKKYKNAIWGFSELWHRIIILICGLVLWIKIKNREKVFDLRLILVAAAIISTGAHIFLESHPRYHHMFLPMIVMYVAELPKIILYELHK